MDRIVPISEARATLGELLEEAREHEVYLVKHGRPAGVLLSVEAYEAVLDRIEDLEDELSILRAGDFEPFETSEAIDAKAHERLAEAVGAVRGRKVPASAAETAVRSQKAARSAAASALSKSRGVKGRSQRTKA